MKWRILSRISAKISTHGRVQVYRGLQEDGHGLGFRASGLGLRV